MSKEKKVFNRKDIATFLQHQTGISKPQSERMTDLVFQSIRLAVQAGKSVHIPNIGIFSPAFIDERDGYDPIRRKKIRLKRRIRVQFRVSKTLKRLINRDVSLAKERIEG